MEKAKIMRISNTREMIQLALGAPYSGDSALAEMLAYLTRIQHTQNTGLVKLVIDIPYFLHISTSAIFICFPINLPFSMWSVRSLVSAKISRVSAEMNAREPSMR